MHNNTQLAPRSQELFLREYHLASYKLSDYLSGNYII